MNEEPPEELAIVVRKNAEMSRRKRLRKLCDTIVADSTGIWREAKRNRMCWINVNCHFIFCLGLPVQSDLDAKLSALITRLMIPLRELARSAIRTLDPNDELICLRVSSDAKEFFLMWDDQFLLTAIQKIETTSGKDVNVKYGQNNLTSPISFE